MRALLILLAVLVGLFAAVTMIGALLPQDYVAAQTAYFSQTPEVVWQVVSDHSASVSWRSDVQAVQQLPDRDGHPVWRETMKQGPALTLETVESIPPRRLVRRIVDRDLPFGGSWTIEIAPHYRGCSVTITERGKIHNPFFRFLSRFVSGHRRTIDNYLKDLGKRFGEDVRPEG